MSTTASPAGRISPDSVELHRLAEEQAALRRVATLVAQGAAPSEVFAAVSEEVAQLIPADGSALGRYEPDNTVTALGGWTADGYPVVGTTFPLEGTVSERILQTGGPARVDSYADAPGEAPKAARELGWRSSVGAPISVEGRLWGSLIVVSTSEQPLPPETEAHLVAFTELAATAIANAESNAKLAQLAEEQASLRRVATLVAGGASSSDVFEAVAREVAQVLHLQNAWVCRYDDEGATLTVLAASGSYPDSFKQGSRWPLDGPSMSREVFRTGRPNRVEDYAEPPGTILAAARADGLMRGAGVPITVDGKVWGVVATSTWGAPLPDDLEGRLSEFTELLATAIANAEGRAELDASRARIVATADATRRRIERDLHDGAQQQLVGLALALRAAQAEVPEALNQHRSELGRVVDGLTTVLDDLREIALGIHPAGLAEDGLTPAIRRLVARSPLRVNLDMRADARFPESVEVAVYYVVSEALTNAAKYAETAVVDVTVTAHSDALHVEIRDEGRGGADPDKGSGLLGLKDRVEAIGGTMSLLSPPGAGTSLSAELPLVHQAAGN